MRCVPIPSAWERAHARVMLPLRLVIAAWLTFLTIAPAGYSSVPWVGAIAAAAAALHLFIAARLRDGGATNRAT